MEADLNVAHIMAVHTMQEILYNVFVIESFHMCKTCL